MKSILLATCLAAALCATPRAAACGFCSSSGAGFRPLQEDYEASAVVALARLVDRVSGREARLRVTRFIKGGVLSENGPVEVTLPVSAYQLMQRPKAFLITSKTPGELTGGTVSVYGPAVLAFIETLNALPPVGKRIERLAFLLPSLRSRHPLIAASASQAFAAAPYADVKALGRRSDAKQLAGWLADGKTPLGNVGVLGLLLGTTGDRTQRPRIEGWLRDATRQQRPGFDGILFGYLLLTGPAGLETARAIVTGVPSARRGEPGLALMRALRYHAADETILGPALILETLRSMLPEPAWTEGALAELARLKDWDSLPAVIALWDRLQASHAWLKKPVRAYLKACPRPAAAAYLKRMD